MAYKYKNMTLAECITRYGISQTELATIIQVTHGAVSHYCTGRRTPNRWVKKMIDDYLDFKAAAK